MKIFYTICLLLLSFSFRASATRWKVGKQQNIHSIQQAIDMSKNGDTILVDAGIYLEKNIAVNKSIVLKGINHPVLDGEKKYEIISVKANDVIVDGFKLQHSGSSGMDDLAAIKIYTSRNVVIRNNILDDNFFGIYTQFGTNCTITNNQIHAAGNAELQNGNGIHCWKSDSMRIIANKVSGHRDGIYFEFVTNSIIWRNISEENIRYGLHFMFSHNNAYISNIFRHNGAGVAVMYTHGMKMYNNIFEESWGDAAFGLLMKDISDSYISGNRFIRNTSGIYMEGSSRIMMEKNIFQNNGWAIKMQGSCDDNTVVHNNFSGNTFDVSTNSDLVLNLFNNNYWDKYEGYDLNRDGKGDVPYRPVSLYSMIIDKNPSTAILFRSMIVTLLDKSEKVFPSMIPVDLEDKFPHMKPFPL
ncbi:MAG TPA: nitrous oxide reductase family maturation protein NosD [Panacibacter sp.]|nr:nitrous oxide reductase family maturation protein NosD [Panacibacter sp.]